MTYSLTIQGRRFRIAGRFGAFHVYEGRQCLAFGIMTKSDAENVASRIALKGDTQ